MNKLKPEDVMRALECCREDLHMCSVCPLNEQNDFCQEDLHIAALALLREKDAEIERLNKHQESVATVCDRANEHYNTLYEQAKEILKAEARSEAITEFAEKLKEAVKYIPWCDYPPVHNCIEEIAEKLKGETDGETDL